MKIPHDKFCVLPWISLEASPIGTVRPCCLAQSEILDDSGVKFSLGESNIDEIRDSRHMREMRRAFLDQKEITDCARCWQEESAGRTSKRQHTLDRLKHIVDDSEWTESAKPLLFMDLKLGNICNLKCRICGSWSSSTYAAEEIRYQTDKKNNFHYVMMQLGRWPREDQRFWQDLDKHLHTIQYLEFTGGEPFMISEHFSLLEKLVDRGYSSGIDIHYNTNGTIFPVHAESIWQNFHHVEIAFSIDDVGARFEYQRSGADWQMVNGHIDLFRDMRGRNSNISLQVCTTVNVFNIMYLDEVAHWIDQQGFDFVYWNVLHDAPHFSVAALPEKTKLQIQSRLTNAEFSPKNRSEIQRIIEFMMQGSATDGQTLRDQIRLVDRRRGENLLSVAPELAAAIDYAA
jgi:sulfatase maturation enzyme AslB (radical SAM superfamily)